MAINIKKVIFRCNHYIDNSYILIQRQKAKKASLLNLRPPDMRPYTIFTPPGKRQKGKFAQCETSRYETRYYFYPPPGKKAKRQKGKFTQCETSRYETRYYFYPPPGKKANLLNLRPPDMRPYTIFTPPSPPGKRQKGKKTNLLNMRPPDMRPDTINIFSQM